MDFLTHHCSSKNEQHVFENIQLQKIAMLLNELRDRIIGPQLGLMQESITLHDLKSACPYDEFSEEQSTKHGTDIVATVMDGRKAISSISISVKNTRKWSSKFIEQIERNISQDCSSWGILVTTAFPSQALNDKFWTMHDSSNRLVLLVKPVFAPVAYYAIRQIIIHEQLLIEAIRANSENGMMTKNHKLLGVKKNE